MVPPQTRKAAPKGRASNRPPDTRIPANQEINLGMGWQHRVRQVAPLKQESQSPEKLGKGWPHGQFMALTGKSMLAGCDPAEPALTGNDVQTGQKVGRWTVSMAAELLDGSGELPSHETRRPRRQPTLEGGSVGLPVAGESCSPDPQQTRLPGEPNIPPELKTEVAVSKGRFRFVPTFCTYISHTALTYMHPARTVAKVTITPPGIVHKGNNYPTGNCSQRLVTPSGTQERPVNTKDTEATATAVNVVVPSKSTFRDRSNIYLLIFIVLLLVGTMSTWRLINYGPTWDTMHRPQSYVKIWHPEDKPASSSATQKYLTMLQTKAHVTRAQRPQIQTPTETCKHSLSKSATIKTHSAHSMGSAAAYSEQSTSMTWKLTNVSYYS